MKAHPLVFTIAYAAFVLTLLVFATLHELGW
jgi:hypothetical protein